MTNAAIAICAIRTEKDHDGAVARIAELMSAAPGSPEEDELDLLATLVDAYEAKHHPMDPPDPGAVVAFRMEQQAAKRRSVLSAKVHDEPPSSNNSK